MNTRNVENKLAIAAALIVLFGVAFAAQNALADEREILATTAVAIHTATETSIKQAVEAQEVSVDVAARAVALDTRFDLDFRLLDPISTLSSRR